MPATASFATIAPSIVARSWICILRASAGEHEAPSQTRS